MSNETDHEKTLFRVMVSGTAISFGLLAAIAVSMKDFLGGNATFVFSYKTVGAFAVGAVLGWTFWRVVRFLIQRRVRDENKQGGPHQRPPFDLN